MTLRLTSSSLITVHFLRRLENTSLKITFDDQVNLTCRPSDVDNCPQSPLNCNVDTLVGWFVFDSGRLQNIRCSSNVHIGYRCILLDSQGHSWLLLLAASDSSYKQWTYGELNRETASTRCDYTNNLVQIWTRCQGNIRQMRWTRTTWLCERDIRQRDDQDQRRIRNATTVARETVKRSQGWIAAGNRSFGGMQYKA